MREGKEERGEERAGTSGCGEDKLTRCADYFQSNPAFSRILRELWKKYTRYGRTAGTISLPNASAEECQALGRFFGEQLSPPLRFRTERFERVLQETRYRGVTLRELLEACFGPVETTKQRKSALEAKYLQLLESVGPENDAARGWLAELGQEKDGVLFRAMKQDAASAGQALSQACRAMDCLEEDGGAPVRLAVLSARATGDPHALDRETLCGKLFLHLLQFKNGGAVPSGRETGGAEQADALYYACGILRDSISRCVSQTGLLLYEGQREHPAFLAFRERHEICTLTLANLSRLDAAASPVGRVCIVENEMVFSQLCDDADRFLCPLVCTSGQLSVAALRLLDLLYAAETSFFYAGDFDGNGISIASRIFRRYPDRFHLWHMGEEDYLKCRTDRALTADSAQLLRHCEGLEELAETVAKDGHAGYQEHLLSSLLRDLTDWTLS